MSISCRRCSTPHFAHCYDRFLKPDFPRATEDRVIASDLSTVVSTLAALSFLALAFLSMTDSSGFDFSLDCTIDNYLPPCSTSHHQSNDTCLATQLLFTTIYCCRAINTSTPQHRVISQPPPAQTLSALPISLALEDPRRKLETTRQQAWIWRTSLSVSCMISSNRRCVRRQQLSIVPLTPSSLPGLASAAAHGGAISCSQQVSLCARLGYSYLGDCVRHSLQEIEDPWMPASELAEPWLRNPDFLEVEATTQLSSRSVERACHYTGSDRWRRSSGPLHLGFLRTDLACDIDGRQPRARSGGRCLYG